MDEQEKKELLIALCGYLPYGVKILIDNEVLREKGLDVQTLIGVDLSLMMVIAEHDCYKSEKIRPYLRPMSSMTEEEYQEFGYDVLRYTPREIDWLNAHYFDYRGLIEKGLALPAPDGMYDTYKYFPPEFKTYTEYVEHLKSKGLAFEAPEGK